MKSRPPSHIDIQNAGIDDIVYMALMAHLLTGKASMSHYKAALEMILQLLEEQKRKERIANELTEAHNGLVWHQPGAQAPAREKTTSDAPPAPRGDA